MKTKDELCERLTAATQEIDVILGSDEKPRTEPLAEDDRTNLDTLEDECNRLNASIEAAKQDEARQQRQDARRAANAITTRGRQGVPDQPDSPDTLDAPRVNLKPYQGTLKAFKGPDGHKNAYRSGQWLAATIGQNERARDWCSKNGIEMLYQSEGSDTAGGFTVIPEFETAIIDLRLLYGVFRQQSMVVPMGSDTKNIPRRVSGLTGYYVGEGLEVTASEKAWDQIQLTARKLAVLSRYSSELDADSFVSMADDLANEMAYTFSREEDQAGFIGDGTSTYGGQHGATVKIVDGTHTASVYDATGGNLKFGTLDAVDFESMVGKLPSYAEANAKWYIHKAGWAASILRLLDAAGGNTAAMLAGGIEMMYLGYPVVFSEVLNSTLTDQASTVLLLFGDLRKASTMGVRSNITISTSDQRYFELDQIGIKGTERYHINVHDLGDTTDAGPLIALKTPAS